MVTRSVLALSFLFLSISANAQESNADSAQILKIVEHFNQKMKNSDWDSAEAIALGARAKFGDNENAIINVMIKNVQIARSRSEQSKRIDVMYEQSPVRVLPDRACSVDHLPARCRLGDDADISEIEKYLRSNFEYGFTSTIEISHHANTNAMIIRACAPTNHTNPPSPKSPD